eukprot:14288162-Ditylum_brightwellii.AAC.1
MAMNMLMSQALNIRPKKAAARKKAPKQKITTSKCFVLTTQSHQVLTTQSHQVLTTQSHQALMPKSHQ